MTRRGGDRCRGAAWVAFVLCAASGCDALGLQEGVVAVSLAAGGVGQQGLGSADADGQSFADGWVVEFSRAIVSISDLQVGELGGETAARSRATYVADLTRDEPQIELLESLGVQRWNNVAFAVQAPTSDGPVRTFDVSEDDVAMLAEGGFSYFIEGEATKGDERVTFSWGIANPAEYTECENGSDDGPGVVVENGATTAMEITVHLEHLLWDSISGEGGTLRFDAIAAMADADGVVPFAALANQSLGDLRDADGQPLTDGIGPITYDASGVTLPRDDLQQFMVASLTNQPHLGGDGRCLVRPL